MGQLRFGAFIAPYHPLGENPTLAIARDFELVQWMDKLGYEEAWIGEHHTAGFELIASPEVFIATAAAHTRWIRLGTGVSSLPYHHPFMLADRMNQLDHVTRGRTVFGMGPGSLPTDATMIGVPVPSQRERMDEAIDVIVPLMRGETVSAKTEWFELNDARLQMVPQPRPSLEIVVTYNQLRHVAHEEYGGQPELWTSVGVVCRPTYEAAKDYFRYCFYEHGDEEVISSIPRESLPPEGSVSAERREEISRLMQFGFRGLVLLGTPEQIVDQLKQLSDHGLDGIALYWVNYTTELPAFVDEVMPLLQQAGLRQARSVPAGAQPVTSGV